MGFMLFYKMFLAFNATSWVIVVYVIKKECTLFSLPIWLFDLFLLAIPILLSYASVCISNFLSKDTLECCSDVEEASQSFLPIYLGYFFIGLGIEKAQHLLFIYMIILTFTYMSQTQYYNPMLILLGFRFYHVTTSKKIKIFLITKDKIRNAEGLAFSNLRRINDTTFIARGEEHESINS